MSKDNYSIVEGPFGKYTFRRVRPADWGKVIKHIQDYFLKDEPTSKLLGYTDQYGEEFAELVKMLLPDNLSFWVEDNETGDVAAVRVTFRHKKDTSFEGLKVESHTLKVLFDVVNICGERCDLFKQYDVEEYGNFFVASCAPKYRKQGITSEMYRRSLAFLKAEGFQMAKSCFTSPFTRAAATNLGFEEAARLDYKEMVDGEGKPVFNHDELNEEHYACNMCKAL